MAAFEVLIDATASPEEAESVRETFAASGVDVDVRAASESRGLGDYPWTVLVQAPLGAFLTAFMAGLGGKAGQDAWEGVKALMTRLRDRRGSSGNLLVEDPGTHTAVVLRADSPDEAYIHLRDIGPEDLRGGYWVFDRDAEEWVCH